MPVKRQASTRANRWVAAGASVLACTAMVFAFAVSCGNSDAASNVPSGDRDAHARPSNVAAINPVPVVPIDPGQLYVPAIGINTNIMTLPTVMSSDPFLGGAVVTTFGVPPDLVQTAWWSDGPQPGGDGMAIITGHSQPGPQYGVFDDIDKLKNDDLIRVESKDGAMVLTFKVIKVQTGVSKTDPTALQNALTLHPPEARLALLTCGGLFHTDYEASEQNVIVFAALA